MKYLKFTYVDSLTGVSIDVAPALNGQIHPNVEELIFEWAYVSQYPTNVPIMFGTCPDYSDTTVAGVLDIYIKSDYNILHAEELSRRVAPLGFKEMVLIKAQARLDSFARERGYDNIQSTCTYVNSTVPRFVTDGICAISARDGTWSALYLLMDEIEQGRREIPTTFAEIEALLPILKWSE